MAKFPKEILKKLAGYGDWEGYEVESRELYESDRWSLFYEMIFKAPDGKFYITNYSKGATENQEEWPYDYDPDEIECQEVRQVEKVVKVWEQV